MKALVMIAHGSRRDEANAEFIALVESVKTVAGSKYDFVEPCFLEIAAPSLTEAVQHVITKKAKTISIFPYFLNTGNHVRKDIPETVDRLTDIAGRLNIPLIFKSSYTKANRSSASFYTGPGQEEGLRILQRVRDMGIPVLSDVHTTAEVAAAADGLDVLQLPAHLSMQTELTLAEGFSLTLRLAWKSKTRHAYPQALLDRVACVAPFRCKRVMISM